MKKLFYIFPLLGSIILSCKKQTNGNTEIVNSIYQPIHFEIVDKNGNSLIHSTKDTLSVTYISNGISYSYRLNIFKIQSSTEDTTLVTQYNGVVISDDDLSHQTNGNSFMVSPSAGVDSAHPGSVRNFTFYLNGKSIGTAYFDFWTSLQELNNNTTDNAFTLNSIPVTSGNLTEGYLVADYPSASSLPSSYLPEWNSILSSKNGIPIYILRYN